MFLVFFLDFSAFRDCSKRSLSGSTLTGLKRVRNGSENDHFFTDFMTLFMNFMDFGHFPCFRHFSTRLVEIGIQDSHTRSFLNAENGKYSCFRTVKMSDTEGVSFYEKVVISSARSRF